MAGGGRTASSASSPQTGCLRLGHLERFEEEPKHWTQEFGTQHWLSMLTRSIPDVRGQRSPQQP